MADTIPEVLQAFARGELVVVTDDDDREGEGDLIVAASLCTADKMAFIIRHTSGIVCAPITPDDARRLRLDPMVAHNDSAHTTAFTVSIDYKPDGGTGISAEERASCCRALANPNAGANDFARPGHIFPLIARDGGVLLRSGHTEAAVDFCKLSGLPPVGVISELMNDDGTVMKGEQVANFAAANKQACHDRRHDRLPPGAGEADRAGLDLRHRKSDRAADGLCLSLALRRDRPRRLCL
jgi:3,4-dihydroxy 2-butanone 4-phosphate synthase/GTP cyclohydrolase II